MAAWPPGRCGGATTTFTWDALNRLRTYALNGDTTVLTYDAFDRLGRQAGVAVTDQYFLWDRDHVVAVLNGTATGLLAQYSYYPGLDALHAVVTDDTVQHYAHTDGLGNVVALTSPSTAVTRTYAYDPWGQSAVGSDPGGLAGRDRARFKGALWMGEAGVELYYMRNRWYEPHSGRFLSEDPIGLAGGINRYTFASSDPINLRDPSGLHSCGAAGGDHIHQVTHDHTDKNTGERVIDSVTIVMEGGCGDDEALIELAALHGAVLSGMGIPVAFSAPQTSWIVNFVAGFGDGASLGATAVVRKVLGWDNVRYGTASYIGGAVTGAIAGARAWGFTANIRAYPSGGGGINLYTPAGRRLLGLDWHVFGRGAARRNLPHLDSKVFGFRHWPWR